MSTEAKAEKLASTRDYVARLAAVIGNGADWEFRDEVAEDPGCQGSCACGHQGLRWLFTIRHRTDGRSTVVGSSCIKSYASINPELVAGIEDALERINAKLAAGKAKARQAERDAEVRGALQDWSDQLKQIDLLTGNDRWTAKVEAPEGADPTWHWRVLNALHNGKLGRLKSAHGKLNAIFGYRLNATRAIDRIHEQNRRRMA